MTSWTYYVIVELEVSTKYTCFIFCLLGQPDHRIVIQVAAGEPGAGSGHAGVVDESGGVDVSQSGSVDDDLLDAADVAGGGQRMQRVAC